MADEHRRVEPRGVVGSGMLTDPERIEQLEHERDRLERTWRDAPKRRFGEVLTEAPARASRDDEDEPPADRRRRPPRQAGEEAPLSEGERADAAADAPAPVEGIANETPLPRVPPDPRMARLHAMVATGAPPHGQRGKRS